MVFKWGGLISEVVVRWVSTVPAIACDEVIECFLTRMELFYFDDNFRRYPLWVLALTMKWGTHSAVL